MGETLSDRELSIEEYGKKGFLRPVQRQELERSIAGIEERLAQPILLEITGGDRGALEKQLVKERAMLERGIPPQLDVGGQRRVYAKMKKCEDIIVSGLPTFTMMERGRPQDVDHHVSHENVPHHDEDGRYTTKRAIQAWKNYRLTLDPNSIEPNFLSIASLRTDTVRGNPALFRKNYDHIRFRELIEDNLADRLDEETYFTFCGLKALDWTEATICRKLDWTQKMYDVAMERMRNDMHQVSINYNEQNETASGETLSVLNLECSEDDMTVGKDTAATEATEGRNQQKVTQPVKRGPHRTPGAILRQSGEPRVQIEPGWPREELRDLGISIQNFCREWKVQSNLFHKFTKNGLWVERHLKTARATLNRLRRKYDRASAEPAQNGEPALTYDSTEPVAVGR